MKTTIKIRLQVLSSQFEMLCIAALVTLVADFLWVVNDIVANGFSVLYAIVATGILTGIIITARVIITHNKAESGNKRRDILSTKLKALKHKTKHKGK